MKLQDSYQGEGADSSAPATAKSQGVADAGACVLIAEDDDGVRELLSVVLRDQPSVATVIEARDGTEAVRFGLQLRPAIALFDLRMPRLDGVTAAVTLRELVPSIKIALQSSDRVVLHDRAGGLAMPLFDKRDVDDMAAWVEKQAHAWSAAQRDAGRSTTR